MLQLDLDISLVDRARAAAQKITGSFGWLFEGYSSVTIERTVLRLMGLDGALKDGKPLPNVVIDQLHKSGSLGKGAAIRLANAMLLQNMSAAEVATAIN